METTTIESVRESVAETVKDMIDDLDFDTDRETMIERMDEECDSLWGNLVYMGRIDQWDEDTLANHAAECGTIIKVARQDAWVEDDSGLWEGMTYGVLPSMAYFSLRNLLYQAAKDAGVDSNDDQPLAEFKAKEAAEKMDRAKIVELLESVSIQCNDDEDDDTLREALVENIKDGTIEYDSL